jgi:S1-C subfamily serine protease
VLFFFTGQHKDYHRPSDDAPAINYEGEVHIINYIAQLIQKLDKEEAKLAFLKTKEEAARATSFKVTLGVMPDYTYSGTGMRIDGVTDGRPGAKAGLKAGDIILKIGDYEVSSVQTYMQTLGKFEKGQKTKIRFKRGNELVEADLEW